jgi:hypothetical protein
MQLLVNLSFFTTTYLVVSSRTKSQLIKNICLNLRRAYKSRVRISVLFLWFLSNYPAFQHCTICNLLNSSIDIDEYIPRETGDWCIVQLNIHRIDLSTLNRSNTILDGSRAHIQAYHCLRDIVRRHIENGIVPFLSESPKPIGRYQVVEAQGRELSTLLQENTQFVRRQENVIFIQNVEEVLVRE